MRRIAAKILISIGIIMLSITLYINYNNYNSKKENDKLVNQYEKAITVKNVLQEDTGLVEEKLLDNIIGILQIPTLNLKVAIQSGTDQTTLKTSVGHFENSALPGQIGNFAVAGHRNYISNKFFSDLDKVQIGDKLKVLTEENEFTYIVNQISVVTPDKVEVLNSTDDRKEITLITCTPKYSGTHRLVIKGELK